MFDTLLSSLHNILDAVISIYFWTLLAYVAAGWLVTLNIANPYHPVMRQVLQGLGALHEPILRPIRNLQYRIVPDMGGFDLSPVVALLLTHYLVRPVVHSVIDAARFG